MTEGRTTLPLRKALRWARQRWLLRHRRAGTQVLDEVLEQTFFVACALSLLSLAVDAVVSQSELRRVLLGKVAIALAFGCSGVLARARRRSAALWLTLLVTVGSLASSAAIFGPTAHGFIQLSSLVLLPFLAVVGTLGELRAAILGGVTVTLASLAVTRGWGLSHDDQVLELFVALMASGVSVAMALVIAESKRQTLHDQRAGRRAARRLFVAQQARARSERLGAVGQLAATMAHEINNPLAYTMANLRFITGVLKERPEPELEEVHLALEESGEGLQRIQEIVERMSAFREPAREQAASLEVRGALELFVGSYTPPEAAHRGRVHLEPGGALPKVALDDRQLGQVLRAVVTNALEAVGAGEGEVRIAAQRAKERVEVTVDDDGPGFEASTLLRLFQPFVTARDPSRLGLSLALSRELLRSVGGELTAGNRPEGGARVVLQLPLCTP